MPILCTVLLLSSCSRNAVAPDSLNIEENNSEEFSDQSVNTDDNSDASLYLYSCYVIHNVDTDEYISVQDCGLSDWMSIGVLSSTNEIDSEDDLKNVDGVTVLVDFRDVPYGTEESDFEKYIKIYELIRDNNWYVWFCHDSDYSTSNLAIYDFQYGLQIGDYDFFTVKVDNIEYLFRFEDCLIG